jgi:hypothetical protein
VKEALQGPENSWFLLVETKVFGEQAAFNHSEVPWSLAELRRGGEPRFHPAQLLALGIENRVQGVLCLNSQK